MIIVVSTFIAEVSSYMLIFRAGSVEEGSISDTSSTECGPTGNSGLKPGARVNVAARPKEKAKDPAYEAEQKAAKDRETIPLEERIVKFKELLSEKDVSCWWSACGVEAWSDWSILTWKVICACWKPRGEVASFLITSG